MPPPRLLFYWYRSVEEVLIVLGCEVILCTGLAAERSTVRNLLKVVQTAGDAAVAVHIVGIQVDGGTTLARREQNGRYSGVSIFSNKIKCGCCGGWYGSKVWHSTDKYRKVICRCNRKYGKDTPPCNTPHLSEEEIKKLFLKALNALVEAKEETIENLQELIETVCQIDTLGAEQERLKQELRIIAENLANLIQKNASVALDQTEQAEKEKKLRTLYAEKHSRFQELEALIQEKNDTKEILTNFITKLEDLTGEQTEFR